LTPVPQNAVLITGCSTGIGRATALACLNAGLPTWATARRVESIADLGEAGCHVHQLDVTDEESCTKAVQAVEAEHGAVGALVNNAGFSLAGAIEETPIAELQRQFDTNVFGLVRMCQLVLPAMRAQGHGRIVNIGSGAGLVSLPGIGAYSMSKYALEALSDSLRFEVRSFGIHVSILEPEGVRTSLIDNIEWTGSPGPYESIDRSLRELSVKAFREGARNVQTPDKVAGVILKAITSRRPKARYKIGIQARLVPRVRRLLSDRAWDALLARQLGIK
jgi:NAD(P)-dependent dehydrogenase (short-subunit alcohol dehydrogenase family)